MLQLPKVKFLKKNSMLKEDIVLFVIKNKYYDQSIVNNVENVWHVMIIIVLG